MKRLLIIGYVWPEPNSSAAGSRMMQLIQFFLMENYSVVFATTASRTPYMADLKSLGVEETPVELNNDSFDRFLSELKPELVLFDRFMMEEQFGWRVSEVCPKAIKILDTEDLHFLRKARQKAVKEKLPLTPSLLQSELAKREIASIYRCDLSLIISESEMKLLLKDFQIPQFLLFYLPLLQEKNSIVPEEFIEFEKRRNFVSLGNFLHDPNWDAVVQLKQHIWPIIRSQLPEAELHIYGSYPSQKVFQLHNPQEKFLVKGRAESVEEILGKARVLLAPLRFGAGIKGKFMDAMRTGTPSVTTSLGAEGMIQSYEDDLEQKIEQRTESIYNPSQGAEELLDYTGWSGAIRDDWGDFSAAAVKLYTDQEKWQQSQENGVNILNENFSAAGYLKLLKERLQTLQINMSSHREQNFTGAMLTHQRVNSTRYLSKYIQMKNLFQKKTSE